MAVLFGRETPDGPFFPVGMMKMGYTDYIVEEGTSGIWTYRKWASGIAECWGTTAEMSIVCNVAWGSIYVTGENSVGNTQFPFEFVDIPILYATFNDGGTVGRGWVMDMDNAPHHLTTAQTGDIPVARAVSYTFTSAFKFYAIGKWK